MLTTARSGCRPARESQGDLRDDRAHTGIRYEERGPVVSAEAKKVRPRKMIRELRSFGYHVELISPAPTA